MKNSETQTQYTAVARNNQLVLILNSEIKLPEDAPVRVTSAQLEELDLLPGSSGHMRFHKVNQLRSTENQEVS